MKNSLNFKNNYLIWQFSAAAIVLIFCAFYFLFAERIPINGGIGWDGIVYAKQTTTAFGTYPISNYYLHRILPSLIIYLFSHLFGYSLSTNVKIANAFFFLNTTCLTFATIFWGLISKKQNFSKKVFCFGFVSLFINYGIMKWCQYDPVLSDTIAFFIGMLVLYLYLKRNFFFLYIVAIASAFIWPICIYFIFLLMINGKTMTSKHNNPFFKKTSKIIALAITIFFLSFTIRLIFIKPFHLPSYVCPINKILLPISLIIFAAYIFSIFYFSQTSKLFLSLTSKSLMRKNIKICLYSITFLIVFLIGALLKNFYKLQIVSGPSSKYYVRSIIKMAVAKPGVFLLAHIVFWGPLIILLCIFYRPVITRASQNSLGIAFFIIGTLFLAIDGESRHLIFNLPIIVYALCDYFNGKQFLTWPFICIYSIISLFLSKIYVTINVASLVGSELSFPFQRLYMNIGPWMAWKGYYINLSMVIISSVILFLSLRHQKNTYKHQKNT